MKMKFPAVAQFVGRTVRHEDDQNLIVFKSGDLVEVRETPKGSLTQEMNGYPLWGRPVAHPDWPLQGLAFWDVQPIKDETTPLSKKLAAMEFAEQYAEELPEMYEELEQPLAIA